MPDENPPAVLGISVGESVKTADGMVGAPPPSALTGGKDLTQEEKDKIQAEIKERQQKYMEDYTRLLGRYVPPHNNKSRWVTKEDVSRVIEDGQDMLALCQIPRGKFSQVAALAHSQIETTDPLRFFVLPNGLTIINPMIVGHTKVPVFKDEGCMTFPDEQLKTMVPRYHKVEVIYQTLGYKEEKPDEPFLSQPVQDSLSGAHAHIFQHECAHLNGHQLYDPDFSSEQSLGLGADLLVPPDMSLWIFEDKDKEEIKA